MTICTAFMPKQSNSESVIVGPDVNCENQNNLCRVDVGGIKMMRRKKRESHCMSDQTLVFLSKGRESRK